METRLIDVATTRMNGSGKPSVPLPIESPWADRGEPSSDGRGFQQQAYERSWARGVGASNTRVGGGAKTQDLRPASLVVRIDDR